MIKKIVKVLSVVFLFLIIVIFYLSIFGIKTTKFNNQINNSILKINKKVNLSLKEINYLLNPYNFTINIKTKNPQIIFGDSELGIKSIKTNISLKSLINDQFLIDDLQIITKEIKLKEAIILTRSFKNIPELFELDRITKGGFINANIVLNFNKDGKVKENYQINGFIKKAKFNLPNQFKVRNLNFDFDIDKGEFVFSQIKTEINDIEIKSSLIEISKKNGSFFVNGKISNNNKEFDTQELQVFFTNLSKNIKLKKIKFASKNDFSFNIDRKLKISNLNINSEISLSKLTYKNNFSSIQKYFPEIKELIDLKDHNIKLNYNKDRIKITGEGRILIEGNEDKINYEITNKNNQYYFKKLLEIKKNIIFIDELQYKKEKNKKALIKIDGILSDNKNFFFNQISLIENDNKILIKDLNLNNKFKISDISLLELNYKNDNKIYNEIYFKKNKKNYIIEGKTFDASKIINRIMENEEDDSFLFSNLSSKINVKIKKTYIDDINFINNLSGNMVLKNNKIYSLNLESIFPNQKKIKLTIRTNKKNEKITNLYSDYPKPLIKRYDFIRGFEEGYLDFNSVKKDGFSNSLLVIDNFKVKEVPIFAKLLSLASLQGIADLLTGEGIRFTDFEMKFSNKKGLTTIEEMYAIGPAVSILMDGYIESKKLVSLRGTLVPATTINRSIASIPLIGKILVGKKAGEGVFGVSFKIKGPPKDLKTIVNPVKTLTPRFITRTLEKIKKN